MIKKTLLLLVCIATFNSTSTMDDPFLIAEQIKTIPLLEQKKFQSSYPQWEKVTQTQEFVLLTKLLKNDTSLANREYLNAFTNLHATKEFRAYNNLTNLSYSHPSTSSQTSHKASSGTAGRTGDVNPFVVSLSNHTNARSAS